MVKIKNLKPKILLGIVHIVHLLGNCDQRKLLTKGMIPVLPSLQVQDLLGEVKL